jgi:hypothetical protein
MTVGPQLDASMARHGLQCGPKHWGECRLRGCLHTLRTSIVRTYSDPYPAQAYAATTNEPTTYSSLDVPSQSATVTAPSHPPSRWAVP